VTDNARHVILNILDPRFLSETASHDAASIVGLADNACEVILDILDPRFSSSTASHDAASIARQALSGGDGGGDVGRRK